MKTHKEMLEGVAGNGGKLWLVVTVCDKSGWWIHREDFKNKSEAECWLKWA